MKYIKTKRKNKIFHIFSFFFFFKLSVLQNIEISLSNTKILTSILTQSGRRYLNNVVELRLSNNNIISGKPLHALNWMKSLKVLDLSNNCIKSINELESIPKGSIKELRLDGNPLCKNYDFSEDYIKDVRKIFPDLTTLVSLLLLLLDIIKYKRFL